MVEVFISALGQSVMITVFVLFMMVVIEYINVQSKNNWANRLQQSPFLQIVIAGLLGVIPGCMGAFTVVSLYVHRMMGLAGLVTVMIATSGDEAFVMYALFPGKALLLNGIILIIAVAAGWAVHLFNRKNISDIPHGFVIHEQENCSCFVKEAIIPQLKKMSFERSVLLLANALFVTLLLMGIVGSTAWGWEKITFLTGSIFLLFVFVTVPEHFLKEHLYDHVIKKHLLRIFLWTLGAFIAIHSIKTNTLVINLIHNNTYLILLIAVLIGIIPESGPHLVFVTLFSQNLIPFSILLTNSIVQDGHGMLPLLAESRRDFVKVKIINMLVGLVVGSVLLLAGF